MACSRFSEPGVAGWPAHHVFAFLIYCKGNSAYIEYILLSSSLKYRRCLSHDWRHVYVFSGLNQKHINGSAKKLGKHKCLTHRTLDTDDITTGWRSNENSMFGHKRLWSTIRI